MEKDNIKVSLALAITSACNLKCFYCKSSGENLDGCIGTIDYSILKDIISASYECGIKNYRITGGEPTIVPYFGELIKVLMDYAPDITARITTNGYKILDYVDLIEKYNDRLEVTMSVDSLNEKVNNTKYEKYLSEDIIAITKELLNRNIKTRYNIVVTKENVSEVPELISKALDLGVNIKLLDLIKHTEYFDKESIEEANELFQNSYQSFKDIKKYLSEITDRYQENFNMFVSTGIPMSGYFRGEQYIQVKESNRGSTFSEVCVNKCPYFKTCQEGMFSPFISNNGELGISNCKNKKLRWNLYKMNQIVKKKSFEELLSLFNNTKIYNNFDNCKK